MLILLLACAPKTTTATEAEPEAYHAPASDKVIQTHMSQNFNQGTAARDAVVAGKLDDARGDLKELAERTDPTLIGRQGEPFLQNLKATASAGASSQSAVDLGTSVGKLGAACGACHASFEVPLSPVTAKPPEGWAGHAKTGSWMVDAMWTAMLANADVAWTEGASVLATAPADLGGYGVRGTTTTEAAAALETMKSAAVAAPQAKDRESRATVIGQIVGACARCHVEQGARFP
jgi:mono/diheme cytochrome c family protein